MGTAAELEVNADRLRSRNLVFVQELVQNWTRYPEHLVRLESGFRVAQGL